MQNLTFKRPVNREALDAELRTAIGEGLIGISTGPSGVVIHVADSVSPQTVQTVVNAHDPSRLTPKQQAEIDRKNKLDQARRDYGSAELDLASYGSQNAIIQKLAQKILWLEREIADLRGG